MTDDRELRPHRAWLGLLTPTGLVVTPPALVKAGADLSQNVAELQTTLREDVLDADGFAPSLADVCERLLDWHASDLVPTNRAATPTSHEVFLEQYHELLRPTHVVFDPEKTDEPLLFTLEIERGVDLDAATSATSTAWKASAHNRLERLLREKRVDIGILFNGRELRLLYTPHGESSGYITFPLHRLREVPLRPALAALHLLLGSERLFTLPDAKRLPVLLRQSRKYQNEVSTRLAEQVFAALNELLKGFQTAAEFDRVLRTLEDARRHDPDHVYGGLLTVLMRLVFLLYAEERDLLPKDKDGVFPNDYGLAALFADLREDAALNPDTMDQRYGAWPQLLTLFRLLHDGGSHAGLHLPPRYGKLFDPDAYAFLEGRPYGTLRQAHETLDPPKVSDGVVYRVLENLLILDGERLSYRALDVEQIGSVYEAMMGYTLEAATGRSVALKPKHIVVDLDEILALNPKDRAKRLSELTECKVEGVSATKLKAATTVDEAVAALGRKISPRTPAPLAPGVLYLQPTEERRRSGSHYTPRSLTAPIVEKTLTPILERLGSNPNPDQILALKVCDPAMGSGAFLVEACRFLGERLVNAWAAHRTKIEIPPDEDPLLHAQRLVVQQCLYGVDKNPFAVDLAKLSLWLATLAKDHPFTFLDHALRNGDSLVGMNRAQIEAFDWEAEAGTALQVTVLSNLLRDRLKKAASARARIHALSASDDVREKRDKLAEADKALADVRLVGDVLVAAFFGADKATSREELRKTRAAQVLDLVNHGRGREVVEEEVQSLRSGRRPVPPFHWQIEFPEVFSRENPGFDAFVGNPPFLGGKRISTNYGDGYRDWLVEVHVDANSNADLVAHFYRRGFSLLRSRGTLGLIATKTIAQGDTRSSGLRWICTHGGTIYSASKRIKWPGAAAVVVSVVHIDRGTPAPPFDLDGRSVERITAFLFHDGSNNDPAPLRWNADKSFVGSVVLGMGFTFDDENLEEATPIAEMHRLIAKNPRNGERIFPFLGGEEVNNSPTHKHRRFIINFGDMPEVKAREWPDLFSIVEQRVKPGRLILKAPEYRRLWWQYARRQEALYAAIDGMQQVLVMNCGAAPHLAFARVSGSQVFANTLAVIALESFPAFTILQSRVHEVWARFFSSSMKDDLRYTSSDCFETFPFPEGWESKIALESIGYEYCEFRAQLMVDTHLGLTKTYNYFHGPDVKDPPIVHLRDLHAAMDRAVLDAYGWSDLEPTHEFLLDYEEDEDDSDPEAGPSHATKPWRYRWPDALRDEVLARLLALNASRAAAEKASEPSSSPLRDRGSNAKKPSGPATVRDRPRHRPGDYTGDLA